MSRDHTTSIFKELTSVGSESVSITPGTSQQPAVFNISGLPNRTGDDRNYVQAFWGGVTTTLDPDAAGNAVNFDKLYKSVASWRLTSPLLGELYNHRHTRGAVVGHIIGPISEGYQYPQPARAQIPASTDTDVTIDLIYKLPMSFEVLKKPHETAQFSGFFDQGQMDCLVGAQDVLDGDYAGAVIKTPTTVRAYCEMLPSPDVALGVPFQWREREIPGGGTTPVLQGVGEETQLTGVQQGCGLVALLWLTDATGIGLAGADGVDNITQIEIPWRGQPLLRNMDPYFLAARRLAGNRVGPTSGLGTTIVPDSSGWPFTMATTVDNRPGANSQAMFLPLILPGRDFETSKAQRVRGNLPINFSFTASVTNPHRFVTWELLEYTEDQVGRLAVALGVDPARARAQRKALLDNPTELEKLRYTRIVFN
jgi:hypothetical protein